MIFGHYRLIFGDFRLISGHFRSIFGHFRAIPRLKSRRSKVPAIKRRTIGWIPVSNFMDIHRLVHRVSGKKIVVVGCIYITWTKLNISTNFAGQNFWDSRQIPKKLWEIRGSSSKLQSMEHRENADRDHVETPINCGEFGEAKLSKKKMCLFLYTLSCNITFPSVNIKRYLKLLMWAS